MFGFIGNYWIANKIPAYAGMTVPVVFSICSF